MDQPAYYPQFQSVGGSSGCDGATIAIIVIVSILVLALVVVLISQAVRPPPNGGMLRMFKKKGGKTNKVEPKSQQKVRAGAPQGSSRPVRASNPPAPMPASQLHAPHSVPQMEGALPGMNVSGANLGEHMAGNSTEAGGVASSMFNGGAYQMDPNTMTRSTAQDMKGVDQFMPNMAGGKMSKNGLVDPSTGLPLHTKNKLQRAHALGGIGPGSFLQPEVDPMSGSRKLGNWSGNGTREEAMAANRAQFNKARLESGNGDPLLWGVGEFAYF